MNWEEKIDQLKKETDSEDFRVPFSDWSTILKKIENKFVIKENSNYTYSSWADRLKDLQKIKQLKTGDLKSELAKLGSHENYWMALAGENDTSKILVYDCKPHVILKIVELMTSDFFIVDKKYGWLTYFKMFNKVDMTVYTSGGSKTPFG